MRKEISFIKMIFDNIKYYAYCILTEYIYIYIIKSANFMQNT